MPTVLLVADRPSVIDWIHAVLSSADVTIIDHADPGSAASAASEHGVDRVIVDMQVGAMGAMAVTRAVRAETDSDPIPVTIILDREADSFLARRAGADTWVGKDASTSELRAAVLPVSSRP
ncbi:MAG: response regulator [Acidimicrobiia bacterium]